MKKLLTILAAAATVFGFASCAGDLHDVSAVKVDSLFVKGTLPGLTWNDDNTVASLATKQSDGSYKWEFLATSPSCAFALDEGGWVTTYRGTIDDKLVKDFEEGVEDPVEAELYPHNDGDCIPVKLDPGATYVMTISSGAGFVNCKIEKTAPAIAMYAIVGGKEYSLDCIGKDKYSYKIEAQDTATDISFCLKSGYAYYAPTKDTDLNQGDTSKGSGFTSEPATAWTAKLKAKIPYQIVANIVDGEISLTMVSDFNCLLNGFYTEGWQRKSFPAAEGTVYDWCGNLSGVTLSADSFDETTGEAIYTAVFKVTSSEAVGADIALHLASGNWNERYELKAPTDETGRIALKTDTWYTLEKGLDPGSDRAYVAITGGENVITATYRSNETTGVVEVKYTLSKEAVVPSIPNLTGWAIKGNMNSGSWDKPFAVFAPFAGEDNTYIGSFKMNNGTDLEMGLIDANEDWKGGIGCNVTVGQKVSFTIGDSGNNHITGLTTGAEYSIIIKVLDTDGHCTFTTFAR